MLTYRPFVTFSTGQEMMVAANMRNEQDKQKVLNTVGEAVQRHLGTFAQSIPPEKRRDFAAKVEFFRVAQG
jgi:hypothetical protein